MMERGSFGALALLGLLVVASLGLPTGVGTGGEVQVPNVAPTIVSVTVAASINPTAGTTTAVSTTIVASDANGYADLSSVTVLVLKPDGSTTHVASTAATFSSGTALQGTYTYSFNMNFYDAAALTTSTYKVKATATDAGGLTGDNVASLAVFNFAELAALNLNLATVDMGSNLDPATTSSIINLGVQNYGNVRIDTQVSGAALSHATESATIPVGSLAYSTASDMASSSALTTSATAISAFDLTAGASSSKSIYWQLTVPDGANQWIPSGTYTGTITVGAVAG